MGRLNAYDLKTFAVISILGAAIGAAYTQIAYLAQGDAVGTIWLGVGIGGLIGLFIPMFEKLVVDHPESFLNDLPFYASFPIRVIIHVAIIFVSIWICQTLYQVMTGIPLFLIGVDQGDTVTDIAFSFAAVVLMVFAMEMRVFIGGRTLTNLMMGRYNRPRLEHRIFVIIDIVGSTALAQKLGDVAFHRYLNRIFHLLDAPIHQHGGEVHSYVGDSVFAVWPVHEKPEKNARVLHALAQMHTIIEHNGEKIEREFGERRGIRAAIHLGPVVTGETGHRKRQITYLGNTVNLVSRIESLTKTGIGNYLASKAFLDNVEIPAKIDVTSLGNHAVKGAADGIEVSRLQVNASA